MTYRLQQNPPKHRYTSSALVRRYIPVHRNLRIGSNHTILAATHYGTIRLPPKKVIVKLYKSITLPVLTGRGTLFLTLI